MSLITKPNPTTNGTTADGAQVSANFDTIYNDYNGNITDANIAASGITTYGKVGGTSLSGLGNINSGAGTIPVVNIPTGTTANKVVVLDGNAKLPAVDGSQLTNVPASTISGILGAPSFNGVVHNTTYTAATDLILSPYFSNGTGLTQTLIIYSDTSTPPTTVIGYDSLAASYTSLRPYFIRKGKNYKVTASDASAYNQSATYTMSIGT